RVSTLVALRRRLKGASTLPRPPPPRILPLPLSKPALIGKLLRHGFPFGNIGRLLVSGSCCFAVSFLNTAHPSQLAAAVAWRMYACAHGPPVSAVWTRIALAGAGVDARGGRRRRALAEIEIVSLIRPSMSSSFGCTLHPPAWASPWSHAPRARLDPCRIS